MEQHLHAQGLSALGKSTSNFVSEEECDACRWDDPFGSSCYCTCPPDPLGTFSAAAVLVRGKPVTDKPSSCTYIVRVWKQRAHQSETGPSTLTDEHLVTEFPLAATNDAADMEHQYQQELKEHSQLLEKLGPCTMEWRAPAARDSYLRDFRDRVSHLMSSAERPDTSECAHIGPRKKGHRHAK